MKTRALVENGTNGEVSLTSLEIPLISRQRDSLILKRDCFLTLVGRMQEDGSFITKGERNSSNPKEIPKYLSKLNPRVLILEDGRIFYDLTRYDPSSQSEIYEVSLFLNEQFGAYGIFEERFNKLYKNFKDTN